MRKSIVVVVVAVVVLLFVDGQKIDLLSPKNGELIPSSNINVKFAVADVQLGQTVYVAMDGDVLHTTNNADAVLLTAKTDGIHHIVVGIVDQYGQPLKAHAFAYVQTRTEAKAMPELWKSAAVPEEVMELAYNESRWQPLNLSVSAASVLDEYIRKHHQIMDPTNNHVPKKFLIVEYNNFGLGNRINGLMTGLIMAVITQRAFLAHMGPVGKFFENKPIAWNYDSMEEMQEMIGSSIDVENSWDYPEMGMEMIEHLTCADINNTLHEHDIIRIQTNQWGGPFLFSNPYYRQWLYQVFGQDVSGVLMRFLFHPSASVQKTIDGIVQNKFKDRYMIGIQLRRHMRQDGSPPCPHTLMKTFDGNNYTHTNSYVTHENEQYFWKCAKSLARAAKAKNSKIGFYLATDTKAETHKIGIAELGLENVVTIDVDTDSYFREGRGLLNETGLENSLQFWSLVEMYVLGQCNDLIITPASTYGYWAAARVSRKPITVTKWNKCFRPVTSQPYPSQWLLLQHSTCFHKAMLTPEFDMLCPSCAYLECPCHGAVPCASHSDYTNNFQPDW